MKDLLSPKQVAASIGVSESSLKRWCDQGLIASEKTPGGHRRIRAGEVIRFLREQQQSLVRPEVLGLPAGSGRHTSSPEKGRETLFEALRTGSQEQARRCVVDLYLSGSSLVTLCEQVVAPALHSIGTEWECGRVEVYQEHRACELVNRILYELRTILPPPAPGAPTALGGTPPGDNYRLATLMVEMVLVDSGWDAVSLGSNLPFATMSAAVRRHEPNLFWLSCSHLDDHTAFREGLTTLVAEAPAATKIVLGGQGMPADLLREIAGGRIAVGGSLAELQRLVAGMRPSWAASEPASSAG